MTTVRNLLSSIWPDPQRTAAMPSSNATTLPTSSRHPHYATYYDLLSTARHGTPLWLPEPNETQHINYRRQGAAIGDVVILTDNGGLHLLFNICLDADDPINGNAVPEGFTPFKPALLASDVHRFDEYGEDSYLASKSITKRRDLQGPAGLWFESSASEGAILAMPEGAYSEDLARKSGFDRYLAENLDSWYHYVNEVREWGVEQGQLRLVTGVHKAKAWGIATFSNERTAAISDLKMVFKSNADVSSGILYSWEFEGIVDSSRSGPTRRQREAVFGGRPPVENQCLFVRTVNASSRKLGGKNRESHSISVPTSQIDIHSYGLEPSGSAGPSNRTSSSSSQGGRFVQNQMGAQYRLPIEQNGPVLRDHPSKAINNFLLEEKPNARIAITHDEDWMSLLTKDDVSLPSGDELVARLKKSCKITEHGGVVSLEFDASVCVSKEEMGKSNGISIGGGELHRAVTGDSYIPAGHRPSYLQLAPYKSHSDRFFGNAADYKNAQRSFPTISLPRLIQLPDVYPENNSSSTSLKEGFASQNSIPVENTGNSASFDILTSPSMSRPKKLAAGMAATVDRLEPMPTVIDRKTNEREQHAIAAGKAKENTTLESLDRITADMGNMHFDDASSSRVHSFTLTKQAAMPEPPMVYSTPPVLTISDTHHGARPIDVGLPMPTPAGVPWIRDDVEKTHRSDDWYAMRRAEKEHWRKSEQGFADLPPAPPDDDEPLLYPLHDPDDAAIMRALHARFPELSAAADELQTILLEEERRRESFDRTKKKKN